MMMMMVIAKVAKATTQEQTKPAVTGKIYLLVLGFNKSLKNPSPDSIFIT